MRNNAHFCRALNDSGFLRRKFSQHCLEGCCVVSFFQVAFYLALRSAMLQPSAIKADAFDQAFGVSRFVRSIVKRIFERGRTDVNDQNFLWPLAFELESVRIVSLLKR